MTTHPFRAVLATVALVSGLLLAPAAGLVEAAAGIPVGTCTLQIGDQQLPVTYGGRTYRVLTHVPANLGSTRALVINMHGATQSGPMMRDSSGMNASSDKHGYAVAYPTGGYFNLGFDLPAGNFWNVDGLPLFKLPPPPTAREDTKFVVAIAHQLTARLCLDRRRTYATGASNGGIMSSYLGCHYAGVFAAVAPVMGVRAGKATGSDYQTIDTADCRPSRPIAILALHGMKDPVLPYAGQPGGGVWGPAWGHPVEAAVARWVRLDRCTSGPVTTAVSPTISRRAWSGCQGGVSVQAMISTRAGHSWWGHPTPVPFNLVAGPDDLSADANELIWSFLSRYRLPVA
jgi:polyhydroxybutyrate depolymerase